MAVAFKNATGLFGNQQFTGDLGLDFFVDKPITVTSLGAFDDQGNGFQNPVTVAIYDLSTDTIVAGSQVTISGTQGTLIDSSRFVSLSAPLTLPAGFNGSVVAVYNGDPIFFGNGPTSDGQNNVLSFGTAREGNTTAQLFAGQFSAPTPLFAAGTFQYTPQPTTVGFTVSDETGLNAAIAAADASTLENVTFQITVSNSFQLTTDLLAINLASASNSVVIDGGSPSTTIDGGASTQFGTTSGFRGFFDYSGRLTLKNLTIADTAAVGGSGSGGGAGLGGGLFVAAAGSATIDNVTFANDMAVGGAGSQAAYGGGGLGGNGGLNRGAGGGGGGIGTPGKSAQGQGGYSFASADGIVPGAASGGSNAAPFGGFTPLPGGLAGGGGGTGSYYSGGFFTGSSVQEGGAGGGIGGASDSVNGTPSVNGGAGGFGGGGGAAGFSQENSGGNRPRYFGNGGNGGFGGGGGFGGNAPSNFGQTAPTGQPGFGGFGGGGGSDGSRYFDATVPSNAGFGGGAQGGGGLGAGGAVFVQQGGSLTIQGGSIKGGTALGGNGSLYLRNAVINSGAGFGTGIFIQGNQTINFAPASGETLTIADVITDQSGSDPSNFYHSPGRGAVDVQGAGTVVLTANNTYTNGTTIENGATLQLGDGTTMGSVAGSVLGTGTLAIDAASPGTHVALPNLHDFAGKLHVARGILDYTPTTDIGTGVLSTSGTINLTGFTATSMSWGLNDTLTLTGTDDFGRAETEALRFDSGGFSGTLIGENGSESISVAGTALTVVGSSFLQGGMAVTGAGTALSFSDPSELNNRPVSLAAGTQLNFAHGMTISDPITVSGTVTFNIPAGQTVIINGPVTSGTSPGLIGVTGGGFLVLNNSTVPFAYPFTAGNESDLNAAIQAIDALSTQTANAHFTIALTQDFALTSNPWAVNVASGSLTIDGGGHTIDGANTYRGLFLNAGTVEVDNVTLAHMQARGGDGGLGDSGSDSGGGGGGAGLGGGIFVASAARLTLDGVSFTGDRAVGGNGGSNGSANAGGAGGGMGTNGANGDGPGGSVGVDGLPALGGRGGTIPLSGGFGGGGGGSFSGGGYPGAGGFGGGGGGGSHGRYNGFSFYAPSPGANGGFGGGGGGAGAFTFFNNGRPRLSSRNAGSGGFGAGRGGYVGRTGYRYYSAGGGGGLGAGGGLFVQAGATLTVKGGSFSGGVAQGGTAGSPTAVGGSGLGSGLFIQQDSGNHAVTLAPDAGETLNIQDTIADQTGGGGTGSIVKSGAGTLILGGNNSFSGGIAVNAGLLSISSDGNLGSGGTLALGNGTTLQLTGNATIAHAITVAGDPTFDVATGLTDTVSGVIADGAQPGDVEKTDGGTLILTGEGTYTGGTVIHAGILQIGDGSAAGSIVGDVTDNASLVLDRADTLTLDGTISGSGSVLQEGSGTVVLNGHNGYAGNTTLASGILELGNAHAAGNGAIVFANGATATLRIDGTAMPTNQINGFTAGDTIDLAGVSFAGGAATLEAGNKLDIGGSTYQVQLDPSQDFSGATFVLSDDGTQHTAVTVVPPVPLTVGVTASPDTLLAGGTATVTFTFSAPVTGFDATDVTTSEGSIGPVIQDLTGDPTGETYTATFTPDALDNLAATVAVTAGSYHDATGTPGAAGSGTITGDTLPPVPTMVATANTLKAGQTSTITISFAEPVVDFDSADLVVTGGSIGALTQANATTYTTVFTPDVTNSENGSVAVAAGGFEDAAGNAGSGGSVAFTGDTLAPSVTVSATPTSLVAGETATVTFVFSEAVKSFGNADVSVAGGTLGTITQDLAHDQSGRTYKATFTPAATDSESGSVAVQAGSYQDLAGNAGSAGSVAFTGDTLAPSVTVSATPTSLLAGQTSAVKFVFSEAVKSFCSGDVTVTGGSLGAITQDLADDASGKTYTATFTPVAADPETGSVAVNTHSYQDLAGNAGSGSSVAFTGHTLAPSLNLGNPSVTYLAGSAPVLLDPGLTVINPAGLTVDVGSWNTDDSFADPRREGQGVELGAADLVRGKLYVFDGSYASDTRSFQSVYDLATQSWTYGGTSDLVARSALGSAVDASGRIYLVDGNDAQFNLLSELTRFDPSNGTMTQLASDPTPRGYVGAVFGSDGRLYVIGGEAAPGNYLTTVDAYDPASNTWSTAADLPGANAGTNTVVALGSKIYVFGGVNFPTLNPDVAIYDIASKTWSTGRAMPTTIFGANAGVVNGKIVIAGGVTPGNFSITNVTEVYDPATDTWASGPSMPLAAQGSARGIISDGSQMLVMGGTENGDVNISGLLQRYSAVNVPGLNGATVTISSGLQAGDVLGFDGGAGSESFADGFTITGSYAAASGRLTLSGTATVADYQTALDQVQYSFAPLTGDPTAGGTDNSRTITWQVTDGVHTISGPSDTTSLTVGGVPRVTVTLSSSDVNLAAPTATVTFTFSEAPANFGIGNITASVGSVTGLSGSGTTYTATFTAPLAGIDVTNAQVAVDGKWHGVNGLSGTGASSAPFTVDTIAPTVSAITLGSSLLNVANAGSGITVTFSEAVKNFDASDLVLPGGVHASAPTSSDGVTWTATLTADPGTVADNATVSVGTADPWTDLAGNAGAGGGSATLSVDTLAPSLKVAALPDPVTAGQTSTVTFSFSEAVSGFDASDVTVTGGSLGPITQSDSSTFTATFTPDVTNSENGSVTVNPGGYTDAAGNSGSGGAVTITGDTQAPTVSITTPTGSLTAGLVPVTFTFSEPVQSFDNTDVTVTGGGLSTIVKLDATTYIATLAPAISNDARASVAVKNGSFHDIAGNAGTGASIGLEGDTLPPSVTVTATPIALLAGQASTVTFAFSEAVIGFGANDVSVTGGTLGAITQDVTHDPSGKTFTATFTPDATNNENGSVAVNAVSYQDLAGNPGSGGSVVITGDTLAPGVTVTASSTSLLAGQTSTVTFGFSEAVSGFDASDVTVTGGLLGPITQSSPSTFTATFTPNVTNSENGSVTVNAGSYTDAAGNAGSGGSVAITGDTLAPSVTVTALPDPVKAGQTSTVTFGFSEAVSGFGNGDVSVSGGTLGTITQDFTDDPTGKTFTAAFTPNVSNSVNGAVTVQGGSYQDIAGNVGSAGSVGIAGDTVGPTVASITVGSTTVNHANATSGDGITVTFSEAVTGFDANDLALPPGLHVGGLASLDGGVTWSGTLTADPNIEFGGGAVSVTATDPWTDLAGNPGVPGFGEAPVTLTLDDALPLLQNDSNAVMAFQAVVGASVLANDFDPVSFPAPGLQAPSVSGLITIGDPLDVTGISDASHGAGSVGGSLAGQYGTLTFNEDGSYRYVADNAASLAEGQQADDVFTYTATDQHGNSATATLDIQVTGHSGGAMEIVSYTAVESKTGDVISGALYDNSGKYTVGSSVTVPGPDNLGGTWTYTVNNIGRADVIRQDVSYSGFAYDFDYLDADTGTVYSTFYGHTGFNLGQNDKANFSGNNGLGSDGDLVIIGGKAFSIASGKYVVPEGAQTIAAMKAVTFQAQESVTGDVITGVLFDNSGKYSVGSSVTVPGPDNAGGTWTYTVTSLADADAKHQDLSYENFAYDLTYKDADLGTVTNTLFGSAGFSSGLNDRTVNYSGNGGLGSDGDAVAVNGKDFAIASGKYVVPEPQTDAGTMQLDTFTAVESVTGDHINGVLFDNTGTYSVGSSVTVPGPDNMGGQWTYTVNSLAAADSAHQSASYNGMVYDLTYFDADTGTSYNTVFGTTGLTTGVADRTANYSGNQGLGSDGDLIRVDGSLTSIASGKYVLPDAKDDRLTTSPASDGQSANLALLTNVMAAFDTTTGQGGTSPIDPSAPVQQPLLTSPHV